MRKKDVTIGGMYIAKVSGKLAKVRITGESRFGGWDAINMETGRQVRIRGAARLRRRLDAPKTDATGPTVVAQAATEPAVGTDGVSERGDATLPNTVDHADPQHTGQEGDETMAKKQSKKQGKKVTGGTGTKKAAPKKGGAKVEKHQGTCPACRRVVELPDGRGRCECGQGLVHRRGRLVRIKETPVRCVDLPAATTLEQPKPEEPAAKPKRTREDGKMSGLDAAAQVLAEAGEPLDTKVMVDRMLAQGLWATSGKTPAATIYAAIIREIAKKGDESRFKKTDRGKFTLAK